MSDHVPEVRSLQEEVQRSTSQRSEVRAEEDLTAEREQCAQQLQAVPWVPLVIHWLSSVAKPRKRSHIQGKLWEMDVNGYSIFFGLLQ